MPTKIDFIGGNTKRCLMAMALPMIAAMFLNMMYNLVDSLWIGNLLGETAYAALTNSTPIILILTSVAMGSTNGISILLSCQIDVINHSFATIFVHKGLNCTNIRNQVWSVDRANSNFIFSVRSKTNPSCQNLSN